VIAKSFWKPVGILPLVLAGCYKYVPTDHATLTAATPVSVELSERGTVNLAPKVGQSVVVLEGNITDASASLTTQIARREEPYGQDPYDVRRQVGRRMACTAVS